MAQPLPIPHVRGEGKPPPRSPPLVAFAHLVSWLPQSHRSSRSPVGTSLQTDDHASTSPPSFYGPGALPGAQPTVLKHWRQSNCWKKSINGSGSSVRCRSWNFIVRSAVVCAAWLISLSGDSVRVSPIMLWQPRLKSINYLGSGPSMYAIGAASSNACKEYNNEP